jgi:hypothetical protein
VYALSGELCSGRWVVAVTCPGRAAASSVAERDDARGVGALLGSGIEAMTHLDWELRERRELRELTDVVCRKGRGRL